MSGPQVPNKKTALALNQKAIAGIDTYFAHVKVLTLAGTSTPPATLKATLQAEIDGEAAVAKAEAQYTQQVVAAKLARSNGRVARKESQGLRLGELRERGSADAQGPRHSGAEDREPDGRVEGASRRQGVRHPQGAQGGDRVERRAVLCGAHAGSSGGCGGHDSEVAVTI